MFSACHYLIESYSKSGHPCMNLHCHVYLTTYTPSYTKTDAKGHDWKEATVVLLSLDYFSSARSYSRLAKSRIRVRYYCSSKQSQETEG